MKNSKPLAVVVDDQESLRVILRSFLEVNGFRVLTAASGRDALRLCGRIKESIEVLITDVQMPGISGFDLAIKASQLRPGIPVLFMSGNSRESDSELRERRPRTADRIPREAVLVRSRSRSSSDSS